MNWTIKIVPKTLMTKISHVSWGGYDKGFYGIKEEFKSMSDKEIISRWKKELIKLKPEIVEKNPLIGTFEEMKIDCDISQLQDKTQKYDQQKSLFEDIWRLKDLSKGPHKWVTIEYINKLSEIFIKYPNIIQ